MRWFLTFRYITIFCLIVLGLAFYIYNFIPHKDKSQYAYIPSGIFPDDSSVTDYESSETDESVISETNQEQKSSADNLTIMVRGTSLSLGESTEAIIGKLGAPGRVDETEYDFDFYIYNNSYKQLLFLAIAEDRVVGFYTDSEDFDYMGIKPGSSPDAVNKILNKDFGLNDIIEFKAENYTVQLFMDALNSHQVTGIYVLSDKVKLNEYSERAMRSTELMVYDLTNSIRARNNREVLSWSSSAALAARKHSRDMADNRFFSHINLKKETSADRLRSEGIFVTTESENLIAGYNSVFESVHKLYNSKTHRNNMLNKRIRYIGVGFAYNPDSKYTSYITQSLYR